MSEKQIYVEDLIKVLDEENFSELEYNALLIQDMMARYRCAMLEVETKFRVLDEHFSLENDHNPINSIKTRLKRPKSIFQKLRRYHLPVTIESAEENLHDIAGVRVVCSFIDDIYLLAECLISQDDITLIEMKDYIKHPKENGYRSLHLIIEVPVFFKDGKKNMKVEVQLRTIAMDFWANLEHRLRYKKELNNDVLIQINDDLLECANISAKLDEKMQNVKDTIEKGSSD